MQKDKIYIDYSGQVTALQEQVSDLNAMMSVMQKLIIDQGKQISDMHKALFDNPKSTKAELREQKINNRKAQIIAKNIRTR